MQTVMRFLLVGIIVGLVGWINQDYVKERFNWFTTMRPCMLANYRPYVLTREAERNLKPQDTFRECARDCPEMIVIPAGEFIMGSPGNEPGRRGNEGPQRKITISKAFAVAEFDVTFADWDACAAVGGCPRAVDSGFGRGNKPVINVSWDDAKQYAAWLSWMTGPIPWVNAIPPEHDARTVLHLLDAVEEGEGAAYGQGRHGNGLSSVAAVRKRPISASHAERELPNKAINWFGWRAKRSQRNCAMARKFRTHTPKPNAIMKRNMTRPRNHTSRVADLPSGAVVSMGASVGIKS
jgi:Sulfatase-modifying factor enzyme 1